MHYCRYAGDEAYQDELVELTHSLVQKVTEVIAGEVPPGQGAEAARQRAFRRLDLSNTVLYICAPSPEMIRLAEVNTHYIYGYNPKP